MNLATYHLMLKAEICGILHPRHLRIFVSWCLSPEATVPFIM